MLPLNEIELQYSTPVVNQIARYAGHGYFIHFGQIPKLGVNLKSDFYKDPRGVYFYDLDWLLKQPRFMNGEQYATKYPYWTIVQLISDNGIITSKLTYEDVDRLAEKNGFSGPDWERFKRDFHYRNPASLLMLYIRAQKNHNAPVRGLDFIHDDGLGVFHINEANQIVIMNPRAMRIIASGHYHPATKNYKNQLGSDKHMVMSVLKALQDKFGGEITWDKKAPTLTIKGAATHKIYYTGERFSERLRIESHWGRAEKIDSITLDRMSVINMSQIIDFFSSMIEPINTLAEAGRDLLFTPSIPLEKVEDEISEMIDVGFKFTTLIENDAKSAGIDAVKEIKPIPHLILTVAAGAHIYSDIHENRWYVRIAVNSRPVAQSRKFEGDQGTLAHDATGTVSTLTNLVMPSEGNGYTQRRFYYEEDYQNFIGWMAHHSGIIEFRIAFERQISSYLKLSDYRKQELLQEIRRVY